MASHETLRTGSRTSPTPRPTPRLVLNPKRTSDDETHPGPVRETPVMVKRTALAAAVAIAGWIRPDAGPANPARVATVVAAHGVESGHLPAATRLTIARLQYDGGGDWYANPSSLPNLLAAIRERTTLDVAKTEARVRLLDDNLWDY